MGGSVRGTMPLKPLFSPIHLPLNYTKPLPAPDKSAKSEPCARARARV